MYMQIDPIHMAYMNSVYSVVTGLCPNFMILGLMMLGVCACVLCSFEHSKYGFANGTGHFIYTSEKFIYSSELFYI